MATLKKETTRKPWDLIRESVNQVDYDAIYKIPELSGEHEETLREKHMDLCGGYVISFLLNFIEEKTGGDEEEIAKHYSNSSKTINRWLNLRLEGKPIQPNAKTIIYARNTSALIYPDFEDEEPGHYQIYTEGLITLINRTQKSWYKDKNLLMSDFLYATHLQFFQKLIDEKIIILGEKIRGNEDDFSLVFRQFDFDPQTSFHQMACYFHDWFEPYVATRIGCEGLFNPDIIYNKHKPH